MVIAVGKMLVQLCQGVMTGHTAETVMLSTIVLGQIGTESRKVLDPYPVRRVTFSIIEKHQVNGGLRSLAESQQMHFLLLVPVHVNCQSWIALLHLEFNNTNSNDMSNETS